MPEYLGKAIMQIAKGMSNNYRFNNYTPLWKENMIGEATINCVKYLKNFDPEKSKNPFGYISQCCYNSFRLVIPKEQEQEALKWLGFINTSSFLDESEMELYIEDNKLIDIQNRLSEYDTKIEAKKIKNKNKLLEIKQLNS